MTSVAFRQSDIFKSIFTQWKIFGLWYGRNRTHKHKYFACIHMILNQVLFTVLLTISLLYAPRELKYLIPDVVFYFTEIAITSKVFMIIIKRDKILEAFSLVDGKDLEGDDESSKEIIQNCNTNYKIFWNWYYVLSQVAYSFLVFLPLFLHVTQNAELNLFISQFYFLTDDFRTKYIYYLFAYQGTVVYSHMIYSISIDAFGAGLIVMGVTQLKVFNNKLKSLKLIYEEKMLSNKDQDEILTLRLRALLSRYGYILRYCDLIQDILSFQLFVVFGLGSIIVATVMCQFLLPTPIGLFLCMIIYLIVMLLQIFLPAYLGSILTYESRELAFAAYCTEWIPRSESFKRSIRIFVERTNNPIQINGLKIFTMSLFTFTSIVKMAFSFFTLFRSFKD